ncbi:hypothetical protein Tco_1069922 [Tanacetum coccineum]|uniref:Reverse transcriptase domain-containing protein n=1 Tax=Tanacetum coccineum TaxID=301880 RepID=A0ABQ5HJZ1_9ASTR
MVPATTSLTGFSGETIWPLGQLRLLVTIGDADHSTRAWMNFMIVRSLSPYNDIIGRPGIREIQAVPSTAHGMLKFPVNGGILTIRSTILIPAECATVVTSSEIPKEAAVHHENFKIAPHPNFPDHEVAIEGTLSAKGRTELCSLLKENLDILAWQPSDMTGVPRSITKHRLNIREGYSPAKYMFVLHLYCAGSGYQQKDRKPSQNDKTEHGMEKTVQNQGQSPKMPKSESKLKNTIGCNLNPSDGPGKPNSIFMKTVKTKWALNQLQQPICVQLTKTVKTLKAQS